jgi:hypothetical protein
VSEYFVEPGACSADALHAATATAGFRFAAPLAVELARLLARLTAARAELDAFYADREAWLARAAAGEGTRALGRARRGPAPRERLAGARERRVAAAAAELTQALPHALAVVARHRPVDDELFEGFLAAPPPAPTRAASFALDLRTLPLACPWAGDLAALEIAVHAALDLRQRFARAAARYRFSIDNSSNFHVNRLLTPFAIAHDLPLADFPAPLSARPPATWPDDLPPRAAIAAVGISPRPPHPIRIVALAPDQHSLWANLAAGRPAAPSPALAALLDLGLVAGGP